VGSVEVGKIADLVLWKPAFFGVKPSLIVKGGMIVAAAMGDNELLGASSPAGKALGNPRSRQAIAQVLGSAFIDDWRVMYVNKEAIDLAAEALMAQGELVGDEIGGLLDSVGLRTPTEGDPYPQEIPLPPVLEPLKIEAEQTA